METSIEETMKLEETKKVFIDFLERHVVDEYFNQRNNLNFENEDPSTWIYYGFGWSTTTQGFLFWLTLHNKWYNKYQGREKIFSEFETFLIEHNAHNAYMNNLNAHIEELSNLWDGNLRNWISGAFPWDDSKNWSELDSDWRQIVDSLSSQKKKINLISII